MLVSILLQLFAAVAAINLIKRTKYNVAWIFFTIALTVLCIIRGAQVFPMLDGEEWRLPQDFMAWMGVVVSLCFAIGTIFIREIFNYIDKLEYQRRLTERRILSTVLRTEENERQRFSKELHDGLGPLLSSAKMSLSVLAKDATEQNKEIFDNTISVIDEAVRAVREISNKLSPHTLKDFGLERAVRSFLNKIPSSPDGVAINYNTNLKGERFDSEEEVILYRVVCELVNNSMRHASCSRIGVSMTLEDNTLTLKYSDNGVGFNIRKLTDNGMGLSNMFSRINSLKGQFDLQSRPGKGMIATIRVKITRV